MPDTWSAYRDESWKGAMPEKWGMKPRVIHLIKQLGYLPENITESNIIFLRSRRESYLNDKIYKLDKECWPFHEAVISKLKPKLIVCLGKTAGSYIRKKLNSTKQIDEFVENNKRRQRSRAYINKNSIIVVIDTHNSIADWTSVNTDPSKMKKRVIEKKN